MGFIFYSTQYHPHTNKFPVTFDYSEKSVKKIQSLDNHKSKIMIHSGNWWSMKNPEARNAKSVLEGVERIHTVLKQPKNESTFMGFMSCNEQPSSKKDAEVKNSAAAIKPENSTKVDYAKIPYWMNDPDNLEKYILKSLENATWAMDNLKFKTPVYCTLQVTNYEQAKKYFKMAYDGGHRYFSVGVSEFLKSPKYKFDGIAKIFEILIGIREVVGRKCQIHLSGLSSYNLIPFINYFGANSCDGSTPVQSALAYGTVFNVAGRGTSASNLKKIFLQKKEFDEAKKSSKKTKITSEMKWFMEENTFGSCKCRICRNKSINARVKTFNEGTTKLKAGETRVIHNLEVWNSLITELNLEMVKNPKQWLVNFVEKKNSPYLKKILKIANETNLSFFKDSFCDSF